MKHPYHKWLERLQFTILFLVIAVVIRSFFGWFHNWLPPADPYKVPDGRASKVFFSGGENDPSNSPGDRLRLFYWLGE